MLKRFFKLSNLHNPPSLPPIPDSNVGLQRCVQVGFLQNDGAGMLWNGEVQDIWTSPDSFAWELLRLLEVTVDCYLLSKRSIASGKLLRTTMQGSVSL